MHARMRVCARVCVGVQVAQLQHAKQYEVAVVEQCFTGSAGDAKENELENALNATKAQLATVRPATFTHTHYNPQNTHGHVVLT